MNIDGMNLLSLSRKRTSSDVARGRMPGSEQAVRKMQQIAERKNIAAKTGIAGLRRSIRYGQLKRSSSK